MKAGKVAEQTEQSILSQEVKQYDYDRWLTCLFAPENLREDLFALLSFNSEIARVRETVSEPMLGDIRLQWWRDALNGLQDGIVKKHPTIEALYQAHQRTPLDLSAMQAMIDMRAKDLDPAPIATDGELIVYADLTSGTLHRLMHLMLTGEDNSRAAEATTLAGRVYGLFGILQAIPFHGRNGLVLIPKTRMSDYGVTENSVLTKEHQHSLCKIVEGLTEVAANEMVDARKAAKSIKGAGRAAILVNAFGPLQLGQFRKYGYDPGKVAGRLGSVRKIISLYRYKQFGF